MSHPATPLDSLGLPRHSSLVDVVTLGQNLTAGHQRSMPASSLPFLRVAWPVPLHLNLVVRQRHRPPQSHLWRPSCSRRQPSPPPPTTPLRHPSSSTRRPPPLIPLVPVHRPTVVAVRGDAAAPVAQVTIANLTIAHAAPTFLEPYEVSSGGDWAVHRGAAIFVDGARDVHIEGNHFDQVDGNGIFFSRFVRHCAIRRNAMTDVGDSGILVVGASGVHRTFQATNLNYPAYNTIEQNYVGNVGVWSKQTSAYYKSVTRENYLLDNVFHDGPRSGVNFNGEHPYHPHRAIELLE